MSIFNFGAGGGGAPTLEARTVTPSTSQQIIKPSRDEYDGLSQVTVEATPLETRTVNPSTSSQTITPSGSNIGFSTITVNPYRLQSKSVTPTTVPYSVSPDSGYNGLSSVTFGKDSNLIPNNINPYKTIYGVQGTSSGSYWTYTMTALPKNDMYLYFDNGGYLCYNKALVMSVIIYCSNSTGGLIYVDGATSIQVVVGMSSYGISMGTHTFDKAMFFYGGTTSNPYYKPYILENTLGIHYDSSKFEFTTNETSPKFREGFYYTAIVRTILTQPG